MDSVECSIAARVPTKGFDSFFRDDRNHNQRSRRVSPPQTPQHI